MLDWIRRKLMFWLGISEAILALRQQGRDHLALTEEVNRLRKAVERSPTGEGMTNSTS